jgi:hypothetical protein
MTDKTRKDSKGMIYTAVTVTVDQQLAGRPLPNTLTACVAGGFSTASPELRARGAELAMGNDGAVLGVFHGDPGDLDGGWLVGPPIVNGHLLFPDVTRLVPSGLPKAVTKTAGYCGIT